MVAVYCRAHHGRRKGLCESCAGLLSYSLRRIETCRFRQDKPVCSKCPRHCYAPGPRERIRGVMRYSGPRMLLRHPALAVLHLLDSTRSAAL